MSYNYAGQLHLSYKLLFGVCLLPLSMFLRTLVFVNSFMMPTKRMCPFGEMSIEIGVLSADVTKAVFFLLKQGRSSYIYKDEVENSSKSEEIFRDQIRKEI